MPCPTKRFAVDSARFFSIYINHHLYFIVLIEYVFNFKCMSKMQNIVTLPSHAFEYKYLEPIISRDIMKIHHRNNHKT
jgi:hypothetical protein